MADPIDNWLYPNSTQQQTRRNDTYPAVVDWAAPANGDFFDVNQSFHDENAHFSAAPMYAEHYRPQPSYDIQQGYNDSSAHRHPRRTGRLGSPFQRRRIPYDNRRTPSDLNSTSWIDFATQEGPEGTHSPLLRAGGAPVICECTQECTHLRQELSDLKAEVANLSVQYNADIDSVPALAKHIRSLNEWMHHLSAACGVVDGKVNDDGDIVKSEPVG